MWEDPIVAEIHRTRKAMAEKFNYDIGAFFADLRKRQAALGDRLVRVNGPPMVLPQPTEAGTPISEESNSL